jgi:hypothetical protein
LGTWIAGITNTSWAALQSNLTAAYLIAAYQLQNPGFLGDVGRNTLRSPHTNVLDFALMPDFPIRESLGMQSR